jgi:hypothetical protein
MAASLKENKCFFVMDQTLHPCKIVKIFMPVQQLFPLLFAVVTYDCQSLSGGCFHESHVVHVIVSTMVRLG